MPKPKPTHLALVIPAPDAAPFRMLVQQLNQPDPTGLAKPLVIEVLAEQPGRTALGNPHVTFALWFDEPASAYWFARYLREAEEAWRATPTLDTAAPLDEAEAMDFYLHGHPLDGTFRVPSEHDDDYDDE